MKRSPINPISDKQKAKNKVWLKVKRERQEYLNEKYGFDICEYCGKKGGKDDPESLYYLDAHHRNNNRRDNTPDNAYICHRKCHRYITDRNIRVVQEGFEGKEHGLRQHYNE